MANFSLVWKDKSAPPRFDAERAKAKLAVIMDKVAKIRGSGRGAKVDLRPGFGTPYAYLIGMRIRGRIILVLLMIPVVLRLIGAGLGIVGAMNNSRPEQVAFLAGHFVGSLLFLALFIWGFRKLGNKSSDSF